MLEPHISEALRRSDRRLVVTGATGWLGRGTLDLLKDCLGDQFQSRVRCFGSQARVISLGANTSIEQRPLDELAGLNPEPTFVLHFAFLTKERAEEMDEAEYRAANRRIGKTVLQALDTIGCEGVFLASSGAVHFVDDERASPAMRLYGELKREDEREFANWAEARSKTAIIARIHNISGPHINKTHSYALACFIIDGLEGRPITVRAPHDVWRGYVALRELASLAFAALLEGKPGAALFDTGGEQIELGALAETVGRQVGNPGIDRPARSSAAADRYVGNDAAYQSLLNHYGISHVGIEQQIAETIEFLAKTATFKDERDWPYECLRGSARVGRDSVPGGFGSASIHNA
jgi:nucleoside-diphosphate-sugar epimerase